MIAAGVPAFKEDEKALLRWYLRQMEATPGITLHLHHQIEAKEVLAAKADAVVIATGSDALLPDLPGILRTMSIPLKRCWQSRISPVAISWSAAASPEPRPPFLHQAGKEVSIVEMCDAFWRKKRFPMPTAWF